MCGWEACKIPALRQWPTPAAVFDKDLMLGGVLFNRIGGDSHKHWLQEAVESSGLTVEVLGGIPKVQPPPLSWL